MYRNSFVLRFPFYPPSETEKRDESLSAQEIFRRIFGRIAAVLEQPQCVGNTWGNAVSGYFYGTSH